VSPSGVDVGSLHWQPVFFSGITIVLGLQALLAGAVLAYRSSLVRGSVNRRFEFVGRPGFPGACLVAGLVALLLGLGLDAVLFAGWVQGERSPPVRGLEVASLAQSLIISGATLASFGIVSRYLLTDRDGTAA
jgi:hypothetical protein